MDKSASVTETAKDRFFMETQLPNYGEKIMKKFVRGPSKIYYLTLTRNSDPKKGFDLHLHKRNESPEFVDITFGLEYDSSTLVNVLWNKHCSVFSLLPDESYEPEDHFSVFAEVTWKKSSAVQSTTSSSADSKLHLEFSEFFTSSAFSDVTIIIGERKLLAHKIILAAASPVISAMLQSPMREALENLIEIVDVEFEVMKTVLKVLYFGDDEGLSDVTMALDVLKVAEKYEIMQLKDMCEQKLITRIKVDNIIEIVDTADTHNAEKLKKACLNFMMTHKKVVRDQDGFKELCSAKPEMMYNLLMKFCS